MTLIFSHQIENFHNLYGGAADSLFVLIHKNEKHNLNIPCYVNKVVFEDFGEPLLNLIRYLSNVSQKNSLEISAVNNLIREPPSLDISQKPVDLKSDLSKTKDEKTDKKIRETQKMK